jgi:uncharacterized protein
MTLTQCVLGVLVAATMSWPAAGQNDQGPRDAVVHVEVLGADAPLLQSFYRELFGWQSKINPAGYGYVPVAPPSGTPLTGGIGPSPQRRPLVIFYVKVDDPAATLKKAESLGGKVVIPPTDAPGGVTFARFADPEGNVIGVVRRPN